MSEDKPAREMPTERKGHPGADSKDAPFDSYLPFVITKGLSPDTRKAFVEGIRKAYEGTRNSSDPTVWKPGSCKRTWDHYFTFKSAFRGLPFRLMMNKSQDHMWYEVDSEDGTLVIDPSGLPESQEVENKMKQFASETTLTFADILPGADPEKNPTYKFRHSYKPYFGLKTGAPDFHRRIYTDPNIQEAQEQRISLWEEKKFRR